MAKPHNTTPHPHRLRHIAVLVLAPVTAAAATLAIVNKSDSLPSKVVAASITDSTTTSSTAASSSSLDANTTTTSSTLAVPPVKVGTSAIDANSPLAKALVPFIDSLPSAACLIVDIGDVRVASVRPTKALAPASTEKVLTATAALNVFGPTHRFNTKVTTAKALNGDTVTGDLYLLGDGDPVLSTVGYQKAAKHQPALATSIEKLADSVAATGLKKVTGTVIGDESKFATDRSGATWGFQYDVTTGTGPLSALVLNDSFTEDGSAVESPSG